MFYQNGEEEREGGGGEMSTNMRMVPFILTNSKITIYFLFIRLSATTLNWKEKQGKCGEEVSNPYYMSKK